MVVPGRMVRATVWSAPGFSLMFQWCQLSGITHGRVNYRGVQTRWGRHVRGDMIVFPGLRSVVLAALVRRPVVRAWLRVDTTWRRSGLGDSSRRMAGLTGGIAYVVQSTGSVGLVVAPDRNLVSAVGRDFQSAPLILTTRGHLDLIKRLMYIGRGCRQRSLGPSKFAHPFKVAQHGRARAVELFSRHLEGDRTAQHSGLCPGFDWCATVDSHSHVTPIL